MNYVSNVLNFTDVQNSNLHTFIVLNILVTTVVASSIAFFVVHFKLSYFHVWLDIAFTNAVFSILLICCCYSAYIGLSPFSSVGKDKSNAMNHEKTKNASMTVFEHKMDTSAPTFSDSSTIAHLARYHTPCLELHFGPSAAEIEKIDFKTLSDDEILAHLDSGAVKENQLEKKLGDCNRAVTIRRRRYEHLLKKDLSFIPKSDYEFSQVHGANCETVIGYVPVPVGVVGPLVVNREAIYVPLATTEGCLVASTNRGCKAITMSGGCDAIVLKDAMTRAPCIRLASAMQAVAVKQWIAQPDNYSLLEDAFNSTTSFGRLLSIEGSVAGRNVYLRFSSTCGDAMGMNMVSKGCLNAVEVLREVFPGLELVAVSGNMCTDKKPAAVNWILGRGKSVVVEATLPESVVENVLKSTVHDMIETNRHKSHTGSAMAGSVGGFNAHASNIVTAVFIATGQDPAQNVESSNCITIMELARDGKSLYAAVTMPSIEVGTVGGGTHLPAQASCLDICGAKGSSDINPGDNARRLALVVGSTVLAGELSLIAALASNHLVHSHLKFNRKASEAPAPL